jgi:hypothetical protein
MTNMAHTHHPAENHVPESFAGTAAGTQTIPAESKLREALNEFERVINVLNSDQGRLAVLLEQLRGATNDKVPRENETRTYGPGIYGELSEHLNRFNEVTRELGETIDELQEYI